MSLPIEHKANDPGHLHEHDLFAAAHNAVAWMPAPSTSAANLANFTAAVADAKSDYGFGGTVQFPPGYYVFEDEAVAEDALGLTLRGVGDATRLVFNDMTDGADWLVLAHCQRTHVCDLQLIGAGSGLARAAIATLRTNAPGMTYAPSQNSIERVVVNGTNRIKSGFFVSGTWIEGGTAGDQNNDFHSLRDSVIQGYTARGIDTRYVLQSYNNRLVNTRLYGGAGALYGIDMSADYGGVVSVTDGFMGGHGEADLRLGRSYQMCEFDNLHSENSKRLLVAGGSHGGAHFRGGRFAANALHADGRMVIVGGEFDLLIESMYLGDSSAWRASAQPTFDVNSTGTSSFSLRHNRIFSLATNLFNHRTPTESFGNKQMDERNVTSVLIP